ncbi:MAG: DUF2279 domain-containing protein [Ignavibacteriaceae bacterium]|nr:DUF2279 domain-containing protein [Ignavibacteriaceae bacterium]
MSISIFKNKQILLIISFILLTRVGFAQHETDSINYYRLGLVSGVTVIGFYYGQAFNKNLWWKGEKSSFHFEWDYDWKYALGSDKFGHFYFPYLSTKLYSQALEWSGLSEKKSLYYSALLAFSYQTFIEVKDGYSKQWGFSWGDFTANTFGALYPILQYHNPILNNFSPKISFHPSNRFKNGSHSVIIDDYESTYDWLSINIRELSGGVVKEYLPSFINLAIGHSVKNLDSPSGGNHEFFIGLDWNLEELPGNHPILKFLKKNLNYYRFPAPVVKIYPDVIWYGLKF